MKKWYENSDFEETFEDYVFCKSWLLVMCNELLHRHIEVTELDRNLIEKALREYWVLELEIKFWRSIFVVGLVAVLLWKLAGVILCS